MVYDSTNGEYVGQHFFNIWVTNICRDTQQCNKWSWFWISYILGGRVKGFIRLDCERGVLFMRSVCVYICMLGRVYYWR